MRVFHHALAVRPRRESSRRRDGMSSIYIALIIVPLLAFASLAVDIGRVRLARAQLQAAADAAARAGASGLPTSIAASQNWAASIAAANGCLGTSVAFNGQADLEFGIWDSTARKFTVLVANGGKNDPRRTANAVHCTASRTTAKNGSIPLTTAAAVGVTKADVAAAAVALIHGGPTKFAIVALNSFNANGNGATVDSYDAAHETYPGVNGFNSNASLASNGNIDMGNGDVYGDVRAGVGKSISQGPNSDITGWRANLDQALSYPPATVPAGATPLPSGKTIPGGPPGSPIVYTTTNLSGDLTFTGAVQIYVTGNVNLKGANVVTSGNLPANLEIDVVGSGSVDLGGNSSMYAHVYAPQSDMTIHGTPGFYGWLVAKSVTLKGTSNIHYDESLINTNPYQISLVK